MRFGAWMLTVIAAVPLMYVLTFPAVLLLPKWPAHSKGGGSIHKHPFPGWMHSYAKPWIYLENETFLSDSLESYLSFWEDLVRR